MSRRRPLARIRRTVRSEIDAGLARRLVAASAAAVDRSSSPRPEQRLPDAWRRSSRPLRPRSSCSGRAIAAALPLRRPPPDAAPGVLVLPDRHRADPAARGAALRWPRTSWRTSSSANRAAARDHRRRRERPSPRRAASGGRGRSRRKGHVVATSRGCRSARARRGSRRWPDPVFSSRARTSGSPFPRAKARRARLLRLTDPNAPWLQQLADRTGYEVGSRSATRARIGTASPSTSEPGNLRRSVKVGEPKPQPTARDAPERRPPASVPRTEGNGLWSERVGPRVLPRDRPQRGRGKGRRRAATSPSSRRRRRRSRRPPALRPGRRRDRRRVPDRVLRALRRSSSLVYLVALAIAFVLVGSIARNVNRLTRATQAIARGDFSVRVSLEVARPDRRPRPVLRRHGRVHRAPARRRRPRRSGSRARSRSLGRSSTSSFRRPRRALEGVSVLAHFEPVAEIGGDYYDYLPDAGRADRVRARRRLRPRPADGPARRHGQGRPLDAHRGRARATASSSRA